VKINEQQLKNNFDALLSDAASTFVYIKEKAKKILYQNLKQKKILLEAFKSLKKL
jgi:hypothetical protein